MHAEAAHGKAVRGAEFNQPRRGQVRKGQYRKRLLQNLRGNGHRQGRKNLLLQDSSLRRGAAIPCRRQRAERRRQKRKQNRQLLPLQGHSDGNLHELPAEDYGSLFDFERHIHRKRHIAQRSIRLNQGAAGKIAQDDGQVPP